MANLKNPIAAHTDAARKALSQIDQGLMSEGPDWKPDLIALCAAYDTLVKAVREIDLGLEEVAT